MNKEIRDELREHSYDGIQEYDNPMPGWWKNLYWATVVFSLFYFVHYELTKTGASVAQEYAAEVEAWQASQATLAGSAGDVSEAALAAAMADHASMAEGATKFASTCASCHAAKGQGLIGPNLTDGAWIHGTGSLLDIYKVVNEGVLAKGMPAWGKVFTPEELRKLVAYVGTLRNTNVPGKAPEGPAPNPTGSAAGAPAAPEPPRQAQ